MVHITKERKPAAHYNRIRRVAQVGQLPVGPSVHFRIVRSEHAGGNQVDKDRISRKWKAEIHPCRQVEKAKQEWSRRCRKRGGDREMGKWCELRRYHTHRPTNEGTNENRHLESEACRTNRLPSRQQRSC